MSKIHSFSTTDDWKCLENLLNKMPRISASKIIKVAIEEKLERVIKNPISLDDFKEETTVPRLDADSKTWNHLMKPMTNEDLRKLQRQIQTKLNIVSDEIYKRTV